MNRSSCARVRVKILLLLLLAPLLLLLLLFLLLLLLLLLPVATDSLLLKPLLGWPLLSYLLVLLYLAKILPAFYFPRCFCVVQPSAPLSCIPPLVRYDSALFCRIGGFGRYSAPWVSWGCSTVRQLTGYLRRIVWCLCALARRLLAWLPTQNNVV